MYKHLSLEELQSAGSQNDQQALLELGKRVLNFDFCIQDGEKYCEHLNELAELEMSHGNEPPPDCPHCRKLIDF